MSEPPGHQDGGEEPTKGAEDDPFGLQGVTIHDKYRILAAVGSGGFGVVYRAVHRGFDEPVAVKCLKLPTDFGERERESLLSRLQEEGRVLHRLSKLSSGIVQALDVGAVTRPGGQWVPYLVLEWLEGESLKEHLASRKAGGGGPYSLEGAMALLAPAARALSVAHRQKVAHRDVKPENLYLTEVSGERTLKVLDFGIAKVLAQHAQFTAAPTATQAQPTAFTPCYGAPEQFNKKRGATGPWTDVFALALILVELVTGERALHGDDATQLYIAAADPASRPTLRYHGVETSDRVEDVLRRALAINPADRYQHAGEFRNALRQAAGEEPLTDTVPADVSETGEFVTRHDIDLDPHDLSGDPAEAAPEAREELSLAKDEPKRGTDDTTPSAGTEPGDAAVSTRRDGPTGTQSSAVRTRARGKPPASDHEGRGTRPPRSGRDGGEEAMTVSSSRWMVVVAVVAVIAAVVLYIQLQEIERPAWMGGGLGSADRPRTDPSAGGPRDPGRPTPVSDAAPSASLMLDGGDPGDAGSEDGGADASSDAGDAAVAIPVPEGMTLISGDGDAGAGDGFFIDTSEVSVAAYRECEKSGRCGPANRVVVRAAATAQLGDNFSDASPEALAEGWFKRCNSVRGRNDHPINCINHGSAADYCRNQRKRLPSSAEWARAAAGLDGRPFPWGEDQPECSTACYGLQGSCVHTEDEIATCAIGSHSGDVTPDGLNDMGGGVAEWVADEGAGAEPHEAPWHVVRGGSFADGVDAMRTSATRVLPPETAFVTIGFRCAQDLPSP